MKGRKVFQKKEFGSGKKYRVNYFIVEDKSWDDTDDEVEYGNLAFMADWDPTYRYEVKDMPPDMPKHFSYRTKNCVKHVI